MSFNSIHKLLILLAAMAVCSCGQLSAQDELEIVSYNTFVTQYWDEIYDHIQIPDGGFMLAGHICATRYEINYTDMLLIKTDIHGDSLWSK